MNTITVLRESRHKARSVVLERGNSFDEFGAYRVLTSTRFRTEEDAAAFFEREAIRRIKKDGDMNESN